MFKLKSLNCKRICVHVSIAEDGNDQGLCLSHGSTLHRSKPRMPYRLQQQWFLDYHRVQYTVSALSVSSAKDHLDHRFMSMTADPPLCVEGLAITWLTGPSTARLNLARWPRAIVFLGRSPANDEESLIMFDHFHSFSTFQACQAAVPSEQSSPDGSVHLIKM